MRACARANGAMRSCPKAASGITKAPPTSTDPFASRRSVTPISRGHANALGFQHPGAFCFWRSRKGNPHDQNAIASRSRSIRALAGPRQGNPRRRKDAPCLDASARAASGCNRTRIGAFDETPMRSIDERYPAVQACCLSGARGTAVAYAGDRETVLHEATLAQLDRAAAKAVGRRFDSGTSHMDSSNG